MKTRFLLALAFLLVTVAQIKAQGPALDPNFYPSQIYQPGGVTQALRQPDGGTLLLGEFQRVAGQPVGPLVRLLPGNNQLDAAFQANADGLRGDVNEVLQLPGGKLLLVDNSYRGGSNGGPLTLGAVSRPRLLQLNADGSPDPSFTAYLGSGTAPIRRVLVQPNGQLLVFGDFQTGGPSLSNILRLNPDGTVDASFQAAAFTTATGSPALVESGGLQNDGKLLVFGEFAQVDGQARPQVARLLSSGALDPSFTLQQPAVAPVALLGLAVQADGKVLLQQTGGLGVPLLRRLLPEGSPDNTFQMPATNEVTLLRYGNQPPLVQPDGKILLAVGPAYLFNLGAQLGRLVRLLPTGALDPSFDNARALAANPASPTEASYPGVVQLLANGQIVATNGYRTSELFHYPPYETTLPVGVVLLNADGTRDFSFTPVVQDFGRVNDVVVQADGKITVGGFFSEINGVAARNLARLLPDGRPDPGFGASTDYTVNALALQADGKLVVGGTFTRLNGIPRFSLGRVSATGTLDNGFAPALVAGVGLAAPVVYRLALQPTGEVLASGSFRTQAGGAPSWLARFGMATGQLDTSYQPVVPSASYNLTNILPQSNGSLLITGYLALPGNRSTPIWRLLPTGVLDPSFAVPNAGINDVGFAAAQDGAGRIYLTGTFYNLGVRGNVNMARLLADGQPDPTFQSVLPGLSPLGYAVAVQPNGRVLVGGVLPQAASEGTLRLLPDGTPDNSYAPTNGPNGAGGLNGLVNKLLIQPDGAILAAGGFPQVGGLPVNALARLLDPNVLGVSAWPVAATTAAWPVPAHDVLHLQLDAASQPQQVQLLDALGRAVLSQAVTTPALRLALQGLPAGVYVLRVRYAQAGTVSRRIVLE